MTLWSIAKSLLMFGGYLRKLDEATYSITTNPMLLEIISFSVNNKEFPYVTGTNCCGSLKKALTWESRSPDEMSTLGFANYKDVETAGWLVKMFETGLERICWKDSLKNKSKRPFCLHKTKLHSTL
ncbi:hypothetical protein GIB67_030960 [Kingdonia uniflora]|uniref:Uncharacterized protein n=1 Tax=Kingdonia uniflora TaxID=39325 RepID=A0A7J7L3J0_9MAGN|nr:hypothetical protein GIB67_030960 [Kingdonia uniflora]